MLSGLGTGMAGWSGPNGYWSVPSAALANPFPVVYVPSLDIHSATKLPESSNNLTLADMLASVGVMMLSFLKRMSKVTLTPIIEVDLHIGYLAGLSVDGELLCPVCIRKCTLSNRTGRSGSLRGIVGGSL